MLSEDAVSIGAPEILSSALESALSASPATTGPDSLAQAATQSVQHQMDSTQHDIASQASMEIAWEEDAHSQVPLPAQVHQAAAAAVATFISPDVSRLSMHELPSLTFIIIIITTAVSVGVSLAVQGLRA